MILIVDTGPLVAAFNEKDNAHEVCAELLATTPTTRTDRQRTEAIEDGLALLTCGDLDHPDREPAWP